jgi:hypothetical protein
MRVGAVGTEYPANVLGSEGFLELVSVPELGRNVRWGDELVTRGVLAAGTLALSVVFG